MGGIHKGADAAFGFLSFGRTGDRWELSGVRPNLLTTPGTARRSPGGEKTGDLCPMNYGKKLFGGYSYATSI